MVGPGRPEGYEFVANVEGIRKNQQTEKIMDLVMAEKCLCRVNCCQRRLRYLSKSLLVCIGNRPFSVSKLAQSHVSVLQQHAVQRVQNFSQQTGIVNTMNLAA